MRPTSEDERRIGLVAVLGLVGLLVLSLGAVGGDRDRGTEQFEVAFEDAGAILEGSDVKVAGVRAGTVRRLDVLDGRAVVTIGLRPAFLPLREDASFEIRPVSLLGERYLDVDPGSEGDVVEPGARFGVERSGSAVDLDHVLNTLDDPTAAAAASIVSALGGGLGGRGEDAAAVIELLTPSLERTDDLVAILDEQSDVIEELIAVTAPVVESAATGRGEQLDALVGSATEMLELTARRQEALQATLERLPATFRTARTSLAALADLSTSASRTLEDVRPVTQDLATISDELSRFAAEASPTLAGLDPVLDHAEELLGELRPIVAALEPAGDDLTAVTASAEPIVASLTREREDVWDMFRNWALVTNGSDGVSHYFRGIATIGPTSVPGIVGLPAGGEGRPPRVEEDGTSDDSPPEPRSNLELLEQLPQVLGGVSARLTGAGDVPASDPSSVTGLDEEQERDLLAVLLGRRS
ncbi:MlaD family protein [Nitriliruptor alkaliphilus]|uniref:MlaD family protein n=1 Tax=Nitriliruptor alkaliphilus TaxID=427918 RepID=UPI000695A560|nr:MlaD family protein [Nitriliruptor alkaliphilus]